jgi:hypothetical protein
MQWLPSRRTQPVRLATEEERSPLLPFLKVQMYSTDAAKLAWKSLPLAARVQYVNDGGEDLARRYGLATATRFAKINAIRGPLWDSDQRLNLRPKRI